MLLFLLLVNYDNEPLALLTPPLYLASAEEDDDIFITHFLKAKNLPLFSTTSKVEFFLMKEMCLNKF